MNFYKSRYWLTQIVLIFSIIFHGFFQVAFAVLHGSLILNDRVLNEIAYWGSIANFASIFLLFFGIFLSLLQMVKVEPLSNYANQLRKVGKFGGGTIGGIVALLVFLFLILLSGLNETIYFNISFVMLVVIGIYVIGVLYMCFRQDPRSTDEKRINATLKWSIYTIFLYIFFSVVFQSILRFGGLIYVILSTLLWAMWVAIHLYTNHLVYRYNQQNIKTSDRDLDLYIQHK